MNGKNFMEVWFLLCNVLLNPNCLILPFESIANDSSVLQCNWWKRSNMLRNQEGKGGAGRGCICSFSVSFGSLMSSENLSKLNWPCPDRILPFLFLGAALMANGILFLSFCQTVIMYCVYKSTTRLIFAKWPFKISLPPWISSTD